MRHAALVWAAALVAAAVDAAAFQLEVPVDCEIGGLCVIQQYPDRDAGPGSSDYSCGSLSYDGHKGTDFRVPTKVEMERGVAVVAAAAGAVRGVRDGMADRDPAAPNAPNIRGRECGNGVVIQHEDGWETQYCHLRKGSVIVAEGDEVGVGDPLGMIGQSGQASFPHLHFALRRNGEPIDPFDGRPLSSACESGEVRSIWSPAAAAELSYAPGGALDAGFTLGRPTLHGVAEGAGAEFRAPRTAPALVFWARFYGARSGDVLKVVFAGPDGEEIAANAIEIPRNRAVQFGFSGKRKGESDWPAGDYSGRAILVRENETVDEIKARLTVN